MKMFNEGAESKVFETQMFGKQVIVKLRHAKAYRIKKLDESLRTMRTRKEARVMGRMSEAGVSSPMLLGVGKFSIYMGKIDGKLLKDTKVGLSQYREIGKMLAKMHNANIIHGDFTPANLIINKSGVHVIDFGLSEITNSDEEKAIDLLLMKRSISKEQYSAFEGAYIKESKKGKQIITRLAEIEKRGRYQIRTLT